MPTHQQVRSSGIYVGCSGWQYRHWRGHFYPATLPSPQWLDYYSERFNTVEINNTFYRLPEAATFAAWRRRAPRGFLYAVKASRYLTHIKRLTDLDRGFKRFYEPLEPLIEAGRLGPVLWQLPENFHRDDERLERWIEALPAGMHTVEFRHESWFVPAVMRVLRDNGIALTIGDHPERRFQSHDATATWRFVRFHYGHRGRGGNYSATEVDEWALRIAQWRRNRTVYAYFNNDWRGFAPANAVALRRRLS
jgi:uncharacterized protein YecE (DUF72 family)